MVIDCLHGKDLEEVIAEGSKLLAGVPSLSGSGVVSGSTAGASEAVAEVPAEVKPTVQEEEDDSDADMGLGLFDD